MKRVLIIIAFFTFLMSCSESNSSSTNTPDNNGNNNPTTKLRVLTGDSVHLSLGVPRDADLSNDFEQIRHQYAFSYNSAKGVPNWVAWELSKDWYGDVARYDGNFVTDITLPGDIVKITHADYTNSGYDRGHLVRSEERTDNEADNKATFYLTNIIPQTPDLNRGVWLDLEYYCEKLCKEDNKRLFVVAGPIIHTNKTLKDEGRVAIPDSCFKIIVVMNYTDNINAINDNTVIYSVIMPNIAGVRSDDWTKYKTTVDQVEKSTGYDFLNMLPVALQAKIESRKN